jgi:hypothetical protein
MKASTNRADEICDYYVKMENIMNQYTKEKLIELENSNEKLLKMIKEEEININELFWNENSISNFNNKNVVYLAFIGYINGIAYYKYGMTKQIYTREFEQHKKTFDTFIMIHIELCDNMIFVENEFKLELKSKDLLKSQEINGRKHIELFITNPQNNIKKIIQMLKDLVQKYPLEIIKKSNDEIKKLKIFHENEKFKLEIEKFKFEIKFLKSENENIKIKQNIGINYNLENDYKEIKEEHKELKNEYKKLKEKYKNIKKNKQSKKYINNEENNYISLINNEIIDNEIIDNENNIDIEEIDNENNIDIEEINNEIIDNEIIDNEIIDNENNIEEIYIDNEIIDNEIIDNEIIDNEIIDNENIIEELLSTNNEIEDKHIFDIKDIVEDALKNNIMNNDIFEADPPEINKYKNKNIELFLNKYIEIGEDSRDNYCRLLVVKLYNFYVSLFTNPSTKTIFNEYIEKKYGIISKKVHNNYINRQTWIGIKIKNVKINIEPIQIMMKLFIDRYCIFNKKYFITSRKFNKIFKEFCRINDFITTKANGWSEIKCIKVLGNLGYLFDQTSYYQSIYKGIRIKPDLLDILN